MGYHFDGDPRPTPERGQAVNKPPERPDSATLSSWLGGRIRGFSGPLTVSPLRGGQSNPTFLLATPSAHYVLRRKPFGELLPSAHAVEREYRVMSALRTSGIPVPPVHLLCEDASVIGGTFFLMERRRGLVIRQNVPDELAAVPGYQRKVSEAFIDCLVRLHAVDVTQPGLNALGKPEGFVERQVRGWADRWERAKTGEQPEMDRVIQWLKANMPASQAPTLVHNDYKLDNVMMRADGEKVEAVLDWEMTTLGDPLADLGLTLCYWAWAAVAAQNDPHPATPVITTQPGWFTRDEFLERYAAKTGRDVSAIRFHEALGIFKLAVILQQIYFRFHNGQTRDERFRDFDTRVRGLVLLAAELVERAA